jgi:hypothetical protein
MLDSEFDRLLDSDRLIHGASKILIIEECTVGYYAATKDGQHHVFDRDGALLRVCASIEEANTFVQIRWTSVAGPATLQ